MKVAFASLAASRTWPTSTLPRPLPRKSSLAHKKNVHCSQACKFFASTIFTRSICMLNGMILFFFITKFTFNKKKREKNRQQVWRETSYLLPSVRQQKTLNLILIQCGKSLTFSYLVKLKKKLFYKPSFGLFCKKKKKILNHLWNCPKSKK
jgi:hypothetical protein